MISDQDKQFLLQLARITLDNKESDISHIPEPLREKGATFVSTYKEDQLLNSIGSLKPTKEIFQDVLDNALILAKENPENTKIEISILKNIQKLKFETQEDLLSQITPNIHGIIIEKNKKIATLLPSVWEQIQDKEEFLNQICCKLQLEKDSWKTNADIFIYETETFKEN